MFRNIIEYFRPKPIIIREGILETMKELLFPSPMTEKINDFMVLIDRSVDSNLQSVLYDLEDGKLDDISIETIRDCILKLREARELLHASDKIPEGVSYVVVDS